MCAQGFPVARLIKNPPAMWAWSRSAAARAADPMAGLRRRHSNTQRQVWLGLCGVSGSGCTQGFVWALWAPLAGMEFDSKCDFAPPTIFLGLLLFPLMWGIFLWWVPIFSCWWLFNSELQFWSSHEKISTIRHPQIWLDINAYSVTGSPSNVMELILLKMSLIYMLLTKMRLPRRTILNWNKCCLRWNNLLLILTFVINRELFGCIWFFTFFS